MRFYRRISPTLLFPTACALFFVSFSAARDRHDSACESPQPCYESVLEIEPTGADGTSEDQEQAALTRLKTLRERYPGTIWAKRAGVLTGLFLAEHEPAEAARLFGAARRDLPPLEDYVRLWEAEAVLRLGEARRAASLFESIPQAVPDTALRNRVSFMAGTAWYKAGECKKATELLTKVVQQAPEDPAVPAALLNVADCHFRQKQKTKGKALLKEIWVRYPNRPEAQEAGRRLAPVRTVLRWKPAPDELYGRVNSLLGLGLQEEAVKTIEQFLSTAPKRDPRREEMRFKLGTTWFRLKRYDQARQVFQGLADEYGTESGEATVWLARTYVRQGDGKQLLALFLTLPTRPLSADQKASIQALVASHHDDQSQDEEAIAAYRHAAQSAQNPSQRAEALWRIGWIQYRAARFRDAVKTFEEVMDDPNYAPQALYWTARALDRLQDLKATEHYLRLCQHYAFTYHCQLAQARAQASGLIAVSGGSKEPVATVTPARGESRMARNVHYRRAVELKFVGMDHEASHELTWLTEQYAHDREALVELSTLLSEAGAHHQAFRLATLHFKEDFEHGSPIPQALWNAAYPTAHLPTIRAHAGSIVDPYLVLAIIREESQYDTHALSSHGAVGLMQMMPTTAQALAKEQGHPEVKREELFEHDTNIRFGVHYLEQLLKQFFGNVAHAVAAYNAGGPTVAGWIAKYGSKEPDEFVEMIPYQETRQYVKRVLHTYREYRRLGGSPCAVGVLDKVC